MAALAAVAASGCSLLGARTQRICIASEPLGARVIIDGRDEGETPLQLEVSRAEDLQVELHKPGYQTASYRSNRKLSGLGITDVIGGRIWLIPFLGLLAPGAWKHDPSAITLPLEPAVETDSAQRITPPPSTTIP